MGFLDSFLGTATSPSTAFNVGAGSATTRYPAQGGQTYAQPQWSAEDWDVYLARQQEVQDREYQLQKDRLKQEYTTAMRNARTNQDRERAAARYNEGQLRLSEDRLKFDRDTQAQEFGLKQARLGYDLIGTAAQLRGPANFYQASEYSRGVSQMPQTSTFLSALQSNARMAGYGAQGGLPERETLDTLTAKLGGGTGLQNGAPGEDQTLAQIGNIAAKGAHQIGAGGLEQLTQTERDLFGSGLDRLGIDRNTFLDQYARSRVNQRVGTTRAA